MTYLSKLSDATLKVVYRIAKTRLRAVFADPRRMIALRNEMQRRGLK